MLIFWTFYYLISFLISFSFYKLFSSRVVGLLIAVFIFGLLSGIWFIEPGSREFAPIVSILFLENTIIESNGYLRLFRPFLISILLGLFFVIIIILLKMSLGFRKRKD
tara:strand:+ start:1620 stop:1943 length:324 start_codon:yes stop_codon:yes gene_type:complete